jgi:RNase H-fold protein (predicted Holliday junction resolvase)/SAM-dependent methyltransferase
LPKLNLRTVDPKESKSSTGGTTKISKIIKTQKLEQDPQKQILNLILKIISEQKTERLKLGLSIYSATNIDHFTKKRLQKILEELRTHSKTQLPKLNLRTVDPKESKSSTLSTAQIVHSGLLKTNGLSLDAVINPPLGGGPEGGGGHIIITQTVQLPNLKKYSLRDYGKPKPSGSNGMLPPKLAQILLSLSQVKPGQTVLDPFCGSGTVLQEAYLQNINSIGTDLNPKIIEDAQANLTWLASHPSLKKAIPELNPEESSVLGGTAPPLIQEKAGVRLYPADATSHTWPEHFDAVVCETYLGTPLSSEPPEAKLNSIITECNQIAEGFLQNLYKQIQKQTIVIALPCWFIGGKIIKLPVVEKLSALGYNQKKSKLVSVDLIYHRAGQEKSQQRTQLVGRDIYVLTKK